ncbi:sugar kinase [Parafrankia soli]|uniref:Sugar kinase n=1 Tax=Parafrankia soli TaxID=2599596 RepID=A0A1S1PEX8_9ACTN|nr:carbohydrate kinase family protein [Parafrankia soli]OHV21478.1 sugar kinase [Parafrankia soli]
MAAVVVAGVVNVQQTIPVEGFPVHYSPVRYAHSPLRLGVAGVGGNVARGLAALGDEVRLATFLADDDAGCLARDTLAREGLAGPGVLRADATAQSAVLVDPDGRRQITTDLKGLPTARYPAPVFRGLLDGAQLASISTIGFARDLLPVATAADVPIAVDLQATTGLDDTYAADWVAHASIVFCSAENLTVAPADFAGQVLAGGRARIVVVGLGARGCLLAVAGRAPRTVVARAPFGVVDTTGAGDALFAGFLHTWLRSGDPDQAVVTAVLAAGWAVGFPGTGRYPTSAELDTLAADAPNDPG